MQKRGLRILISLLLLLVVIPASVTSCAPVPQQEAPILQSCADSIDAALSTALLQKASAMEGEAQSYEESGEQLTDQSGANVDMAAYIAALRTDAGLLKNLSYRPYVLAIMDDIYARSYVDAYIPVVSCVTDMVDLLASNFYLSMLTTPDIATEALIHCYIRTVGDTFGSFINNESSEDMSFDDSYVGIGITVTQMTNGYIEVISVSENSPAQEAGILAGDVLLSVDGEDVALIGYNETLNRVRGAEGTSVSLTLQRGEGSYTVSVVRKKLIALSVSYRMLTSGDGSTGYIRLSGFDFTTFSQFVSAVEDLEAQGAQSFIFDVRSNPGGQLDSVLGILEYIVPDESDLPLIRMEYKDETVSFSSVEAYLKSIAADKDRIAYFEKAKDHHIDARIAVLCNAYTASAGELFTSCLKDFGMAEVYGETTYGKGVGQSHFQLTDYYAYLDAGIFHYTLIEPAYFLISTFYYSPPVSDNYHKVGVVPHHTVALSDAAKEYYISSIPEQVDNQLLAALAFVQSEAPLSAPSTSPAETPQEQPQDQEQAQQTDKENDGSVGKILFITLFSVALVGVVALTILAAVMRKKERAAENIPFFTHPKADSDHTDSDHTNK